MRPLTFLLIFILASFLIACETKVDIHIEGEESAVVIGLLDPTLDTQFVKITHTFLTDGNAFDVAQIQEMSEYHDLEAYVIVYDGSDSVDSYLLQEKTVTDKDSGVFYYPAQTVYYFTEPLNYDYMYELKFFGSENEVSSTTEIVGDFNTNISILFPTISLVEEFDFSGSKYQNKSIIIETSKNTKRYQFTFRYHYLEIYIDGTEIEKHLDFKYAPIITSTLMGSEMFEVVIDGNSFYQNLAGRILAQNNEENVLKRIIGKMDYIFEYAGDDFNTFIALNEPSTSSINIEANPYTNVINGIGVWSSRGNAVFIDREFSISIPSSILEMAFGQYTGDLKFCSDAPAHVGTSWGCN